MARCNVLVTEKKKSNFRSRDVGQDLGRLVKVPPEQHKEVVAAPDAAALLTYIELLSDDTNYGKYMIQPYSLYMRLDAAALRALNANKNFSFFDLMNRTCTQGMGKGLLNRWLKQPLVDVPEITKRINTVQASVQGLGLRQELRSHLRRMPDIERLVSKLEKRRAVLQDVVKRYTCLCYLITIGFANVHATESARSCGLLYLLIAILFNNLLSGRYY